ncbi:DUF2523 family protein [Geobacter sp. SVR]|uniref:DUF2523 family protein n=1 Tax=Geobacter sp. SVR TaxID=2495594 RepID=UPI00143F03CF|nr:DUF2523 family protein [Geobacter sp. SVR]BCS53913.1 hypothetical protein GSVR_22210 [Geobacter sp. SVR]GCF86307.1 hypothetical protein GSbR_29070 [Geobacter sp. SVR]
MQSVVNAICSFLMIALKWLLDGAVVVIKSVLYFIFDGLLTVILAIFQAIDLSALLTTSALSWAGLPDQLIWFLNAVNVPQGLTILLSSIGIRMAINLIPAEFTRL